VYERRVCCKDLSLAGASINAIWNILEDRTKLLFAFRESARPLLDEALESFGVTVELFL
jgi:hypothetical protein